MFDFRKAIPDPSTLSNNTATIANEGREKLKCELAKYSALALTSDHYKDHISQVKVIHLVFLFIYLGFNSRYILGRLSGLHYALYRHL